MIEKRPRITVSRINLGATMALPAQIWCKRFEFNHRLEYHGVTDETITTKCDLLNTTANTE